jgi:hypothetical protein
LYIGRCGARSSSPPELEVSEANTKNCRCKVTSAEFATFATEVFEAKQEKDFMAKYIPEVDCGTFTSWQDKAKGTILTFKSAVQAMADDGIVPMMSVGTEPACHPRTVCDEMIKINKFVAEHSEKAQFDMGQKVVIPQGDPAMSIGYWLRVNH